MLKKLNANIGYYTISNIISASIPFIFLPVLTRLLSKEDFGRVEIYYSLVISLIPIISFGLPASLIRYFHDKSINKKHLVNSTITYSLLISFGVLILSVPVLFFTDLELNLIIFLAILTACLSQLQEIYLNYSRSNGDGLMYGLFKLLKSLIEISLTLLLIKFIFNDWLGRASALIITSILFSLIGVFLLKKQIDFNQLTLKSKVISNQLKYSIPTVIHSIGSKIIAYADKFIILSFLDFESVALYSIHYQMGLAIGIVSNSINLAWTPEMFKILNTNSNSKRISTQHRRFLYFYILITALAIIIFPTLFPIYAGEKYELNNDILTIILVAYFVRSINQQQSNYFFYYKRTKILSIITFTSVIVSLLLGYFLIQYYNLLGAAITTLLTMLVQFIQIQVLNKKYDNQ